MASRPARADTSPRPSPASFFWWLIRLGDSGGGKARGALRVFRWWERFERRRHDIRPVAPGAFICYSLARHGGPEVRLEGGELVRPGDLVVELHLENRSLAGSAGAERWNPFAAVKQARADFTALAGILGRGELGPVRALHGQSLVSPSLARFGFRVTPMADTWHTRLVRFFLVGLLAIYHPRGWAGAERERRRGWPSDAWLGREEFERRFGAAAS